MKVTKAKETDLVEIVYLVKICVKDMNSKGMEYWNNTYPDSELIHKDLDEGKIYIVKDSGVLKGMISISENVPHEYEGFAKNDVSTLYIQRLAVHPNWKQQNINNMLIEYAEDYARKKGFKSVKINVFSEHEEINELCQQNNFLETGKFLSHFQKTPFIFYEKKV